VLYIYHQTMDKKAKILLMRWQSLESGTGLKRARSLACILWFIGLALCLFIAFGLVLGFHPAITTFAATAMGWIIAETNALRNRSAQWQIFRRYIDWKLVQEDLMGCNREDK
jgi:hypothetical protein